jgi:uncharacterized protein (DUF4415 family)
MNKRPPLIDKNGEVRELTAEDMRLFKPAHEVLPPALQKTLGMRVRGPQKALPKVSTTIRLSPEVVEAFRAGTAGKRALMRRSRTGCGRTRRCEACALVNAVAGLLS